MGGCDEVSSDSLHCAYSVYRRDVVLYTGSNVLGFAEDMQAVPVSALWEISSQATPALGT